MPGQPRTHGESSADVTYRSTGAAPKQQRFSHRRRSVKTYGRPNRALRELKQGTLTQMEFASSAQPDCEDFTGDGVENDENDPSILEVVQEDIPVKKNKASRNNRRKTAGDELGADVEKQPRRIKRRKTMGDHPHSSASSTFHTQTLTQMLSAKDGDDDPTLWQINDSEGDEDLGFVMETPRKPKHDNSVKDLLVQEANPGDTVSAVPSLVKSITPSNRQKKTEIPSSQSPLTPMLMRYSPGAHHSPLKSKSTNVAPISPIIKKLQKTPRNAVIPDSYSTSHSSPVTPSPKPSVKMTSVKQIRFDLPENKENITPGRTKPKFPRAASSPSGRQPLQEVPDSDEDLYDTEDEEVIDEDKEPKASSPHLSSDHTTPTKVPEPPDTCYGAFGEETQAELLSSEQRLNCQLSSQPRTEETAMKAPEPEHSPKLVRNEATTAITELPNSTVEQTPVSTPPRRDSNENALPSQIQYYTQGLESQRLPLETIRALGPQTPRSDIMVSLYPEHLTKIVDGSKNHEFRTWRIPPDVSRIWIYATRPVCELKYMCIFGPCKLPGETTDETGIGNLEFNQGNTVSKYAYEILQVYQLNDPVSLQEMKNKGWIAGAPQKYTFIPPAVVGELTANLQCALFGEAAHPTPARSSPVDITVSQEIIAQIQNDVEYSTQHHSSERQDEHEIIPSSQTPRKLALGQDQHSEDHKKFTRPARPMLRTNPSTQGLPTTSSQRLHGFVRASQATTVSQVTSSPVLSPEKSLPPVTVSSHRSSSSRRTALHHDNSSSPTTLRRAHQHSLRSSQFPTRSQMLPDSLMNEEIQEPPPIVWDSVDEHSD